MQSETADPAALSELRRRIGKRLWDREREGATQRANPAQAARAGATSPAREEEARRIVLFVGAGASAAFGFPVTNQILPQIWRDLHDESETGGWRKWAGFKATANRPAQANAARELKQFLSSILPGLDSTNPGAVLGASIVDVISMLEHSAIERQSPFPPAPYTAPGEKLVQPASELLRARNLLNVAINGVLDGRESPRLRKDLASWILERAGLPRHAARSAGDRRVTIISTNYDTSMERLLYTAAKHLPGGVAENVDLGLTWRDRSGHTHSRRPDAGLAVFKLHGSLDWLRCETCGWVTINTETRVASLDSWDVKREYNSCVCGGLLKSLLVTPSVVRNIRDPNLLSLWNAALEDLRCADEWIMAGYSLPSEDVAIRSLLLRAFHSRRARASGESSSGKELRVRVVLFERDDPGPPNSPADAYRAFFPTENFSPADYDRRGFKTWFEELRHRPARHAHAEAASSDSALKSESPTRPL